LSKKSPASTALGINVAVRGISMESDLERVADVDQINMVYLKTNPLRSFNVFQEILQIVFFYYYYWKTILSFFE
jgi:hypothetical protein